MNRKKPDSAHWPNCSRFKRSLALGNNSPAPQHVTCSTALVPSVSRSKTLMAWTVGRMSNSILRRLASHFTSSITGNAPVPVPTRQSKANVQFTVRKTMRDAHEEMNTDNSGHVNGSSVHRCAPALYPDILSV